MQTAWQFIRFLNNLEYIDRYSRKSRISMWRKRL